MTCHALIQVCEMPGKTASNKRIAHIQSPSALLTDMLAIKMASHLLPWCVNKNAKSIVIPICMMMAKTQIN